MFSCALYCKVDLCSCWSKMRWCRCSKQDRRQCHRGAEAAEHSPPSACDALYCLLQSYMLRCLANRTLLPLKCTSGSFLVLPPSIHTLITKWFWFDLRNTLLYCYKIHCWLVGRYLGDGHQWWAFIRWRDYDNPSFLSPPGQEPIQPLP